MLRSAITVAALGIFSAAASAAPTAPTAGTAGFVTVGSTRPTDANAKQKRPHS